MDVMVNIAYCKTPMCNLPITIHDVVRQRYVRDLKTHVVVTFKCPGCGVSEKIVAETAIWNDLITEGITDDRALDVTVAAFAADLESLAHTVNDLKNIWASYNRPPPIERKHRAG